MTAMIPIPSGVRVWIATGHTDMRRGMRSLALTVQEILKRDPHAGDLYIFRGRRGNLVKILWHDGLGMSLYATLICGARRAHGRGICRNHPLKGHWRCKFRGGPSTGARTPEGQARVTAAMVAGRRRWVEMMRRAKAEGLV